MIKSLIDSHFANYYHLGRKIEIDAITTISDVFDIDDYQRMHILPFGDGFVSFSNSARLPISLLDYEGYIDKYSGTIFHEGLSKCDYLLEIENYAVILIEITSSSTGMSNLSKPISGKKSFAGGKFEKVEYQLTSSLQTLAEVDEINNYFNGLSRRVCLCAYKLYNSPILSQIGNPVHAFNRGMIEAEREAGENGVIISCPKIEEMGFEYRRISHTFAFRL